MDIIFNCPNCDQELAVDQSGAGTQIDCPSCGNKTVIAIEKPKYYTFNQSEPENSEEDQRDQRIYLSYSLAVFVPLAGFFSGIYLMAKKEHGHGAVCMGISVFCLFIWLAVISSM